MEYLILARLVIHVYLEIKDWVGSRNLGGGEIGVMKNKKIIFFINAALFQKHKQPLATSNFKQYWIVYEI